MREQSKKTLSGIKKKLLGLDWVAAWDSPGMPVEGGFNAQLVHQRPLFTEQCTLCTANSWKYV